MHPRFVPARRVRGLSLPELLVALCIAAVLLAQAAPAFGRLLDSVRVSTATNAFLASLRLARSEALKTSGRVALCKSADGLACSDAGGWEQGWIVFRDRNGNGERDAGETVVQREEPVGGQLVISGNQPVAETISFAALGGTRMVTGGLQAGSVTVCSRSDAPAAARRIVLTAGGRARIQRVEVSRCEPAPAPGAP
jgi:type IV fimbrial biogenesis protein FimT